jgi:hypothetical protein
MTESEMQASLFAELEIRDNQDPRYKYVFAVPNGQYRPGQRMEPGLRAGVPDILFLLPACGFHGLAMELKVNKNKPSAAQSEWLQWLSDRNYFTCVVYDDPGEAMRILGQYMDGAKL